MNFAEGFRRVFKTFGVLSVLGVIIAGVGNFPGRQSKDYSAAHSILDAIGEEAAKREGRDRPWTSYDMRTAWFNEKSDQEVIGIVCNWEKQTEPIKTACKAHRESLSKLPIERLQHIGVTVLGAAAVYLFWLGLWALLAWIGRGFFPPPATPPSA